MHLDVVRLARMTVTSPVFRSTDVFLCRVWEHSIKVSWKPWNSSYFIATGFFFPGEGIAQSNGTAHPESISGGVVFAYSKDTIRIWLLDPLEDRTGIIVVNGWGGQNNQQISSAGKLRVRVFCDKSKWAARVFPKEPCLSTTSSTDKTQLIAINVTEVLSLTECFRLCAEKVFCRGMSWSLPDCHQFSELQFGESEARDNDMVMHWLERHKCQWKCSDDPKFN